MLFQPRLDGRGWVDGMELPLLVIETAPALRPARLTVRVPRRRYGPQPRSRLQ